MTAECAIKWLDHHGIETRTNDKGQLEAMSYWTDNGQLCGEWELVTCTLRWLRDWMQYQHIRMLISVLTDGRMYDILWYIVTDQEHARGDRDGKAKCEERSKQRGSSTS